MRTTTNGKLNPTTRWKSNRAYARRRGPYSSSPDHVDIYVYQVSQRDLEAYDERMEFSCHMTDGRA